MVKFEEGWEAHAKKLKKYLVTTAKLKEWTQMPIEEEGGMMQWVHSRTGERQVEHPGIKYYNVNKKSMRKRAEQHFQENVLDKIESEKAQYQLQVVR